MNEQSPPKRVTRARAAAKTDTDIKVATASSRAKAIPRTTAPPATKRKTRADSEQRDDEIETGPIIEPELPTKTTRGRRAKAVEIETESQPEIQPEMDEAPTRRGRRAAVVQPEPEAEQAPVKATRGRQKKVVVEPAPTKAPVRSLRGRAVEIPAQDIITVAEPTKRPTRGRVAAVTKPTAPKKSVKFEEPDKENFIPLLATAKAKAKVAEMGNGLKAKPVRKPAATRATRGRPKVEEPASSPLSPKKITQVATANKDHSDDELATTEKTPMKPLMKSPIKAPGSVFGTAKKLDFSTSSSVTVNRVTTQDLGASMMGSPARRPPKSPFKDAMKASPQRSGLGDSLLRSPFKLSIPGLTKPSGPPSPFKESLLQSPARRPQSPMKVTEAGSPCKPMSTFAVTPKAGTFKISRFTTPRTLTKSVMHPRQMIPPTSEDMTEESASELVEDLTLTPKLLFGGRLSSIVPREIDSAVATSNSIIEETEDSDIFVDELAMDSVVVQEPSLLGTIVVDSGTPTGPLPENETNSFALRGVDENPFIDYDSEDELASPTPFLTMMKTPRITAVVKTFSTRHEENLGFTPLAKQLNDWMASSPEKSELGASDSDCSPSQSVDEAVSPDGQASPVKSTYFDDEMSVRDDLEINEAAAELDDELTEDPIMETINFEPVELDEEDVALAEEAEEMSLLELEEIIGFEEDLEEDAEMEDEIDEVHAHQSVEIVHAEQELAIAQGSEDLFLNEQVDNDVIGNMDFDSVQPLAEAQQLNSQVNMTDQLNIQKQFQNVEEEFGIAPRAPLSEASQDYADENTIPIDPVLLLLPTPGPSTPLYSTPRRVLGERVFHTVSKVPLKAAADDTPMRPSPMKRSASIGRMPSHRPSSTLSRSNTVISYSPSKRIPRSASPEDNPVTMQQTIATPSKADTDPWSIETTPARTPRRDLKPALLQGAVVFVDVHTTEGADASALFTELLTQMGARCVKRWDWNGNSEEGGKVGITHVVFKDGGKRTLEKVRDASGVVTCVGVGWVLDCERENQWLPESPYGIDTSMVPRGGHRRRKSMEPRALAKLNDATLAPSTPGPTRLARKTMSPTKEAFVFPDTPFTSKSRRRDSVQWVRSPSTGTEADQTIVLSPVPTTPAPETISAYGEDSLYGDETPNAQTPYFLNQQLVQKTAPAGKRYFDGEGGKAGGFLEEKKDESVMMRLMAARRKSLQWAPKVGSPLARSGGW